MRSLLFVPAHVERYVAKAPFVGADAVILDLEDSVPEEKKGEARRALGEAVKHVRSNSDVRVMVRVNSVGTDHFRDDVVAALEAGCEVIVLPKCNDAYSVVSLRKVVEPCKAEVKVMVLIESAKALLNVAEIASSWSSITGLAFGEYDFALSMGTIYPSRDLIRVARALVAIAAKAHGQLAIDTPYARVSDLEGLRTESIEARAFGFDGKLAIHPDQVPVINEAFSPTREEIEWARRVVSALEAARSEGRSSTMLDGSMVDEVHYRLARMVLGKQTITGRP
ncbi:MAG: CoA ester lyase [Thaumarchaeota archaeon]|nr:CoA ester lyase [Candidatus Calditenuaceae archaeon]MDW8187201.1 CoA ester lyase [Nitrososphaerota archaeon]